MGAFWSSLWNLWQGKRLGRSLGAHAGQWLSLGDPVQGCHRPLCPTRCHLVPRRVSGCCPPVSLGVCTNDSQEGQAPVTPRAPAPDVLAANTFFLRTHMKEIVNQHDYSSVNAGSPEPGGHLTSLCSQDHKQCIQHQPRISAWAGPSPAPLLASSGASWGDLHISYCSEGIKNSREVPIIERL